MTLGDKLSRLRKENNFTQEQLAEILGVSRQAVSRWESDAAFPETEKLIRISDLYGCSLDYLLRKDMDHDRQEQPQLPPQQKDAADALTFTLRLSDVREKKSERQLWGMPLYHAGRKARGVIAVGFDAQGIVAIGFMARGIISFGLLSVGVVSFGLLALGLLAFGSFAFGLAAAGAIAAGIISAGAIALGDFSVGALAIGKYAALGDSARGMIAIGKTEATGTLFEKTGDLSLRELERVKELLDANVPALLGWAKAFFKSCIG